MSLIGHNSGFECRDDLPDGLPRMETIRFHIRDVLEDLDALPLDVRGFYVTFLLRSFQRMEAFPADDEVGARAFGKIDIRTYRRLKAKCLEIGLLYQRASGRISTARFDAEITDYVVQYRNRQITALARETAKKKAQIRRVSEVIEQSLPKKVGLRPGKSSGEVWPNSEISIGEVSEKPNKNNESYITVGQRSTVSHLGAMHYSALSEEVSQKPNEINGGIPGVGQRNAVSGEKRGDLKEVSEKANEINVHDDAIQPRAPARTRSIYITNSSLVVTSEEEKIRSHQQQQLSGTVSARAGAVEQTPPPGTVAEFLARLGLSQDTVYQRLMDAGGKALSPLAIGLVQIAQVIAWLRQGCDFEADVLPAVRMVSLRAMQRRARPITSWAYFEGAVLDARNVRMAVPKASDPVPQVPTAASPMAERVAYYLAHNPNGRELLTRKGRAAAEADVAKMLAMIDERRSQEANHGK